MNKMIKNGGGNFHAIMYILFILSNPIPGISLSYIIEVNFLFLFREGYLTGRLGFK